MSFEEQFPSHKNWSQTPTINSDGDMTIHISDMMKHCLDKQLMTKEQEHKKMMLIKSLNKTKSHIESLLSSLNKEKQDKGRGA